MKKTNLLGFFALVLLLNIVFISCEKTTSYNCNGTSCTETSSKGEYKTLTDCQKCASANKIGSTGSTGSTGTSGSTCPSGYNQNISGSVEIVAQITPDWETCKDAYIIEVSIYRTSTDRANGNFVFTGKAAKCDSPVKVTGLCGGKYFYDMKRTFNFGKCGQPKHTPPGDHLKTATFEIKDANLIKLTCNMTQ